MFGFKERGLCDELYLPRYDGRQLETKERRIGAVTSLRPKEKQPSFKMFERMLFGQHPVVQLVKQKSINLLG